VRRLERQLLRHHLCGRYPFYKPVLIGQVVEVRAQLIHTGTTSMHIAVDVFSRDPKASKLVQTTHCIIIFVAVNGEGPAGTRAALGAQK